MRVTIGMPVYNGAATIAAALDSLLAQTVTDFALVISDNGSTDGTEAICRDYVARDPRVSYVRQATNLGATMNFRYVLHAATTPYFMWAAGDDLWAPTFIETHLAALEATPQAVACQSRVLFTKGGQPSHMSTGTYALTGTVKENLARFLWNPADNSRYYALFRTDTLQSVFPGRNFFALDWGVSAATLQLGTYLEIDRALMIRDSSDTVVYEESVRRDHRFLLWRIFPILFMTLWLVVRRRIPLNGPIIKALFHLNLYIHLRFGMYKLDWLARQHLNVSSPLRRAISLLLGPRLGSRLRRLGARIYGWVRPVLAMVLRPARKVARMIWRALPLSLAQREVVKRVLVRRLGGVALKFAVTNEYLRVIIGTATPIPTHPGLRGRQEDLWRLAPAPGEAVLSVVLGVRDGLEDTLRCIDALNEQDLPIEIIVVDNASTDITPLALAGLPGIRFHRISERRSVGQALLDGAALASAPAVVLLEQGVIPAPDFLEQILRGLEQSPVIAPQIRDREGYVRSTGGRFGSPPNPATDGQRLTPSHPLCLVRTPVDYAHGAIALRAKLLPQLAHCVGGSSFIDLSRMFFDQLASRGVLARYWSGAALYRLDDGEPETQLGTAAGSTTRNIGLSSSPIPLEPTVLYVDSDTPMPDQNAGSIESLNFMRILLGFGFRVLFVPESNFAHRGKYTDQLLDIGINALYADHFNNMREVLERFGRELDLVVLCRTTIAGRYIDMVRELAPRARIVFNTIDLHFLRERREAVLSGDRAALAAADETRAIEVATMTDSDATIVLSTAERDLLRGELPEAEIHVLPMVRDLPDRLDVPGFAERRDCMFVGTYQHPPNQDAVVYFVGEIWPLVRSRLPDAKFFIVGSSMTPAVQALAGNGVEVLGFVEDLDALLAKCRLTVAPVRFGAGLKGKLISSLQAGVPSVASSIAAEGFGLVDGVETLIADTPERFADAVVRLYEDQALWERVSQAGFDFMKRDCTMDGNIARIRDLLGMLGIGSFEMELRAVQAELRAAGPEYVPSAFWQWLSEVNTAQINHQQLLRFKRTINNNYFQFLPGDVNDPQMKQLAAFCQTNPSTWPQEAAQSAHVLSDHAGVTSAFDYNPFTHPEYPRLYGYFVGMLWHFACTNDPVGLWKTLEEPELGQPIPVQIQGHRISQDLANSLHEWSRVLKLVKPAAPGARRRVLEIGAGYGRVAHVALHSGVTSYAIVDIPPALVVAKWYLCNLYPDLKVFGFRHFDRYEDVAAEIEAADLCFFSSNQLTLLPEGFADIGIAISCLHEMRLEQISFYLDQLSSKTTQAVYMKNWTTWKNPSDGIVVDRDTFRLPGDWRCMLDEMHPINIEMWETGYVRD